MRPSDRGTQSRASFSEGWVWLAASSILLTTGLAYAGSLGGPTLYDDMGSITENPTIRHLATSFRPLASGWPVSGRPLLNFTFALNYAAAGLSTPGYHLVNLAIHLGAALFLFGFVRRTLVVTGFTEGASLGLAWASALLWAVHPVQTESVTYLSQRAESLMGLWYLLTLYAFVRAFASGTDEPRWGWAVGSWIACLLGMASKEVMATAPVVLFFYDRAFLSASWSEVWRRRGRYYGALALTWVLLAVLVAGTGGRGGTAGFGSGIQWWAYAITQFRAIALYFRLSLWPQPLLFNYGLILGGPRWELAIETIVILAVILVTVIQGIAGSRWAFLGIWFFGILAPTSSVIPVSTELIAEHRVYLSLAAVTTAAVLLGYFGLRRLGPGRSVVVGIGLTVLVASVAAAATFQRNRVYASAYALWNDTVAKAPYDAGARNNLGNTLVELGRNEEAIVQFRAALQIAPEYSGPHQNVGNLLMKLQRYPEAATEYQAALLKDASNANIHYELGDALRKMGRPAEANRQFDEALKGRSESAVVWYDLGNAFLDQSRTPEALASFEKALALRPDYPDAILNHAGILDRIGRSDQAIAEFRQLAKLQPDAPDVHNNLGGLLAEHGQFAEAKAEFQEALRLKPDYREARDNLERVLAIQGQSSSR